MSYRYAITVAVVARFQLVEDTLNFDPALIEEKLKELVGDALIENDVEGNLHKIVNNEYGPIPGILNVYCT
mgnify:CR=1 FL=1